MSTSSSDVVRRAERNHHGRNMVRAALCLLTGLSLFIGLAHLGLYLKLRLSPMPDTENYRLWLNREDLQEVEAVTLGNSHSLAIDFDGLGMTGQHLFLAAMDLHEAAAFASVYLPDAPGLRLVLMPVSPELMYQDNGLQVPAIRRHSYAVLLSRGFALIRDDFVGWGRTQLDGMRSLAGMARAIVCQVRSGLPCDRPTRKQLGDPFFPAEVTRIAARNAGVIADAVAVPAATEPQERALLALARTLSARGTTLVFYPSPLSRALTEASAAEYRRRGWEDKNAAPSPDLARAAVDRARAAGLCVHLVEDLWDGDTDARARGFYKDPDHLNTAGAREFSVRLARYLAGLAPCGVSEGK